MRPAVLAAAAVACYGFDLLELWSGGLRFFLGTSGIWLILAHQRAVTKVLPGVRILEFDVHPSVLTALCVGVSSRVDYPRRRFACDSCD